MKVFLKFIVFVILLIYSNISTGQVIVSQFNAGWNSANKVTWLGKLTDVDKVKYIDIAANPKAQQKYKIVVVPTIIVFKDGSEVKRFQADISFSMKATRSEIQSVIDDSKMSDY